MMASSSMAIHLVSWHALVLAAFCSPRTAFQHAAMPSIHSNNAGSILSVRRGDSHQSFVSELAEVLEQHLLPVRAIDWVFDSNGLLMRPHPNCHGLWLEFGVFNGLTINKAAEYRSRYCGEDSSPLYGFDTFTGLPETWYTDDQGKLMEKGTFSLGGQLPSVLPNVRLIEGLFNETLPVFVATHYNDAHRVADITFLHIDCDLYQGTIEVLTQLGRHIAPGCVLIFDELFNYPTYRDHEIKAFWEWLKSSQRQVEVIGMLGPLPGKGKAVELNPEADLGGLYQSVAFKVL